MVRTGGMDATISSTGMGLPYLEVEGLQAKARALVRLALQVPTLMIASKIASIAGSLNTRETGNRRWVLGKAYRGGTPFC